MQRGGNPVPEQSVSPSGIKYSILSPWVFEVR